MKYQEALKIIEGESDDGFMVTFERRKGSILTSDHFPDKHAGEKLIESEEEAWKLARKFARKTKGKCINIHVVKSNFVPVDGYRTRFIENEMY